MTSYYSSFITSIDWDFVDDVPYSPVSWVDYDGMGLWGLMGNGTNSGSTDSGSGDSNSGDNNNSGTNTSVDIPELRAYQAHFIQARFQLLQLLKPSL